MIQNNYSASGFAVMGILMAKIEFWTKRYEFSFQFWGEDNNNVYINRGTVEIASFGGEGTIREILERTLAWCEKASPSLKYPQGLTITNHQP